MYHLKLQHQSWFLPEETATPAPAPGLPSCGEEQRAEVQQWPMVTA